MVPIMNKRVPISYYVSHCILFICNLLFLIFSPLFLIIKVCLIGFLSFIIGLLASLVTPNQATYRPYISSPAVQGDQEGSDGILRHITPKWAG